MCHSCVPCLLLLAETLLIHLSSLPPSLLLVVLSLFLILPLRFIQLPLCLPSTKSEAASTGPDREAQLHISQGVEVGQSTDPHPTPITLKSSLEPATFMDNEVRGRRV